jgi:hypothetical protein
MVSLWFMADITNYSQRVFVNQLIIGQHHLVGGFNRLNIGRNGMIFDIGG